MSFQDKLNAANKELSMSKMSKYSYNSPICFLLNAIGVNARPLHYNTFLSNFIILSVWFSSAWGGIMWFTQWSEQNMSIVTAIVSSLVSGILFGLIMAWYYQYSAKENNLSDWQQL